MYGEEKNISFLLIYHFIYYVLKIISRCGKNERQSSNQQRTSRSRLLLKNVRNLSSKAAKGKKGAKGASQKTSEVSTVLLCMILLFIIVLYLISLQDVSAATKESKPIQQQSSKATESTASQQPSNVKSKSDKPSTEKKKMGAFGKTVIGAAIGLPIGLLAGMKY